jgi:hypothetical protein
MVCADLQRLQTALVTGIYFRGLGEAQPCRRLRDRALEQRRLPLPEVVVAPPRRHSIAA